MFHKFREQVEKLCGPHARYLEMPRKVGADVALPCFAIAKEKGTKPEECAAEMGRIFSKRIRKFQLIRSVETFGPYVNFYADWQQIGADVIRSALSLKSQRKKKEKVIVEFAHPNTHKLFHIGHLRNITTGEAVSRILEFTGAKVVRANYQGDVGLHIAKCLWGIQKSGMKTMSGLNEKIAFLGKAYAAGSKAYEEEEAKKQITEINRKIYEKDKAVMKLWSRTRKWSLEYFDRIYKRVYTRFDRLYFESEVAQRGLDIAKEALRKGILTMSDGAVIFDGRDGLDRRVFVNRIGFPTYEAKELGLAELEFSEFRPDRCVHVVGPEQSSFFKVTFKVEELLDEKFSGRQHHLVYGWVRLSEGKMSSRMGNVVEGEWLLDELKKAVMNRLQKQKYAKKAKEEIAEAIAVGAAKYYFLKFNTASDISFDMTRAVSIEGDTGPYLQYTHARATSILRKSRKKAGKGISFEEGEIAIVKKLSMFPFIVKKCAQELKPNYLANYLFELATAFNEFYHSKQIIGNKREAELLLFVSAVAATLKTGLELLGIKALERM